METDSSLLSQINTCMKELGSMTYERDKAWKYAKSWANTLVSGKKTNDMARVLVSTPKETFTEVLGNTV